MIKRNLDNKLTVSLSHVNMKIHDGNIKKKVFGFEEFN